MCDVPSTATHLLRLQVPALPRAATLILFVRLLAVMSQVSGSGARSASAGTCSALPGPLQRRTSAQLGHVQGSTSSTSSTPLHHCSCWCSFTSSSWMWGCSPALACHAKMQLWAGATTRACGMAICWLCKRTYIARRWRCQKVSRAGLGHGVHYTINMRQLRTCNRKCWVAA